MHLRNLEKFKTGGSGNNMQLSIPLPKTPDSLIDSLMGHKANAMSANDVIKVKTQRSFFPMSLSAGTKEGSKQ